MLGYLSAAIVGSEKFLGTDDVRRQISEHILRQTEAIVFISL